jgi:serine O-acetyltransferase
MDENRPTIEKFSELVAFVKEDYATNDRTRRIWTIFAPGFQAALAYRLNVWCNGIGPRVFRVPMRVVLWFFSFFVRSFYGIEIFASARIGRRLRIAHQHGIVIHPQAVIGDDCVLRQGVTIGSTGISLDAPQIGDRVRIGAGAVLAGKIKIGDDVTIGPNAVVMTSVPAGSIVASPQSRIMSPPPRKKAEVAVETPKAQTEEMAR